MAVSKLIYYTCHNVLLMLSMCITSFESLILFQCSKWQEQNQRGTNWYNVYKGTNFWTDPILYALLSLASLLLAAIAAYSSDYHSSSERQVPISKPPVCWAEQATKGQGLVIIPKFD